MRRALGLCLTLGCTASDPAPTVRWAPAQSTTIAHAAGRLLLASPDDDRLVVVDPDTLAVIDTVALPGGPNSVAPFADGVLVTFAYTADVAWVRGDDVQRTAIPCGGTDAAVLAGDTAFLACPNDDRVVQLAVADGRVLAEYPLAGRPTALAVDGARLSVGLSRTGQMATLVGDRWDITDLETTPGVAATRLAGLSPTSTGVVGVYQRVDHDSDRDRPPEAGGYGSVVDGAPRIVNRLFGPCASDYVRFDGGTRVFSGARAIAVAKGRAWIAHEFTDNLAVLDCATGALLGQARVGRGPRGLVVRGDTAWIDVGFDHAVARATLGADGLAVTTLRRETGPQRFGPTERLGRSIFHDAVNTHLTPSGVVTCATCHPAGGEDGLRWFLHTPRIARKVRRTPPGYAARTELAPYHFDGEFADVATLTQQTIVNLLEGDGLLIDASAVGAWLDALPAPPGRPAWDADDAALIEAGRRAFERHGCAECHAAPRFADGRAHPVDPAGGDPDARLDRVDTPSLIAVRARPPFLHDGRAATLRDVIAGDIDDGIHGIMAPEDVHALIRYLESL